MAIVRLDLALKGGTLIHAVSRSPKSELVGTAPLEPAPSSALSAEDQAFLSRMIKLGLERQANTPAPIDADGATALHRPRSGGR